MVYATPRADAKASMHGAACPSVIEPSITIKNTCKEKERVCNGAIFLTIYNGSIKELTEALQLSGRTHRTNGIVYFQSERPEKIDHNDDKNIKRTLETSPGSASPSRINLMPYLNNNMKNIRKLTHND